MTTCPPYCARGVGFGFVWVWFGRSGRVLRSHHDDSRQPGVGAPTIGGVPSQPGQPEARTVPTDQDMLDFVKFAKDEYQHALEESAKVSDLVKSKADSMARANDWFVKTNHEIAALQPAVPAIFTKKLPQLEKSRRFSPQCWRKVIFTKKLPVLEKGRSDRRTWEDG